MGVTKKIMKEIIIEIINSKTQLSIHFIDNGIGISEKKIPYIFDKFYRISENQNLDVKGFGLGLYYVKKVCDLHHWKVIVKNNLDQGITFSIINQNK